MDSSSSIAPDGGLAENVRKECDTTFPATPTTTTTGKHPSSHRTPSFSSSSSLSSCLSSIFADDYPLSPATPLRISGVPFSWEHLPGIPKKSPSSHHKKEDSLALKVLPLPPTTATATPTAPSKRFNFDHVGIKKKIGSYNNNNDHRDSFKRDPFFAALMECSKGDDDHDDDHDPDQSTGKYYWNIGPKVTRSISDRFGFISLYTSCKRTSAVSESIVYLPRSSSRTGYDLITSRRSS